MSSTTPASASPAAFASAIKVFSKPEYEAKLTTLPLEQIGQGNIVIRTHYSSLNYKDALAITGKGRILKNFPLIPGIDVAGEIIESDDSNLPIGQAVLINGCGLGEIQDGGFSEIVRAPSDWVVAIPDGLTAKEAMIIGTAGFTASLCLWRMKQMDQTPGMGPIAITGASGGVGSIAVQLFSQAGFEVTAISGKEELHDVLIKYGANKVVTPKDLNLGSRPLESAKFAGAVDNVGGDLLAGLIRHINLWGNVACVGLASSHELNTTVMPMILRGVSLLGISSGNCPQALRTSLWQKLATEWKPKFLNETLQKEISLEDVLSESEAMLNQKTFGRTIVKI